MGMVINIALAGASVAGVGGATTNIESIERFLDYDVPAIGLTAEELEQQGGTDHVATGGDGSEQATPEKRNNRRENQKGWISDLGDVAIAEVRNGVYMLVGEAPSERFMHLVWRDGLRDIDRQSFNERFGGDLEAACAWELAALSGQVFPDDLELIADPFEVWDKQLWEEKEVSERYVDENGFYTVWRASGGEGDKYATDGDVVTDEEYFTHTCGGRFDYWGSHRAKVVEFNRMIIGYQLEDGELYNCREATNIYPVKLEYVEEDLRNIARAHGNDPDEFVKSVKQITGEEDVANMNLSDVLVCGGITKTGYRDMQITSDDLGFEHMERVSNLLG